jgi:serine/threonine protein kinase
VEVEAFHKITGHMNVPKFLGTFQTDKETNIVMERANNGTFKDYLKEKTFIAEAEMKNIARQLLNGIKVNTSTIIVNTFLSIMLACALDECRASGLVKYLMACLR